MVTLIIILIIINKTWSKYYIVTCIQCMFVIFFLQYHLNDSHNQAYVHWAGDHSDTVVVLTRDRTPTASSTSHVWVSKDYIKLSVENRTSDFNLTDGNAALISMFYASPVDNQRVS